MVDKNLHKDVISPLILSRQLQKQKIRVWILPLGVAQMVNRDQSMLSRGKVNFDKVQQTQNFPPLRPVHFQSVAASQGLLTIATAPFLMTPRQTHWYSAHASSPSIELKFFKLSRLQPTSVKWGWHSSWSQVASQSMRCHLYKTVPGALGSCRNWGYSKLALFNHWDQKTRQALGRVHVCASAALWWEKTMASQLELADVFCSSNPGVLYEPNSHPHPTRKTLIGIKSKVISYSMDKETEVCCKSIYNMKEESWKTQGRKVQEWGRGGEARKLQLRIPKILKTCHFICLFKM